MKDLLPLEAYLRPDPARFWRGVLGFAVWWGVPLLFCLLLVPHGWWNDPWPRPLAGLARRLVIGAAGGLALGLLFVSIVWISMRRLTRRIHRRDPAVVPPPPPGRHEYRLVCSYVPNTTVAVGGHLYAAPDALRFVAHGKSAPHFGALPTLLPAGPGLVLEPFDYELSRLQKLFAKGPERRLRIRAEGVEAVFATPDADQVADTLRRYYRSAAASPSASGA